jgi:hypothetical protein
VLLLFLPAQAIVALVDAFQLERFPYLYALIGLAIGLYLTYAGFSRQHRA